MLDELRQDYIKRSIEHCQQVIKDFEEELQNEDIPLVKEMLNDIIIEWKRHKVDYQKMLGEVK